MMAAAASPGEPLDLAGFDGVWAGMMGVKLVDGLVLSQFVFPDVLERNWYCLLA